MNDYISKEDKEWLEDIEHAIEVDNDKHEKPNIAKLCFENNT